MFEWQPIGIVLASGLLGYGGSYLQHALTSRRERAARASEGETRKIEAEPELVREVNAQLRECRESERQNQKQLARNERQILQLKANMQTLWLAMEMVLAKYPDAAPDVHAAMRQMRERQREFIKQETEADRDSDAT